MIEGGRGGLKMPGMALSLTVVREWQSQQGLCGQRQEGGLKSREPWMVPSGA